RRDYPDLYRGFHENYFPIFDKVGKPGQLDPKKWEPGASAGYARRIAEYGQIMYPNYWEWMTEAELDAAMPLWGKMSRICLNIRQTVDKLWEYEGTDDWILDDQYTGPIDWPPNWRAEVADVDASEPENIPRSVAAGQPCPRTGWWFTPAAKSGARRYFDKGAIFP
ncbi:MAG: hypothetical protein ACTS5I_03655, partial [Rhodanobacter sp.]